jgi:hypothetical protein
MRQIQVIEEIIADEDDHNASAPVKVEEKLLTSPGDKQIMRKLSDPCESVA